MKPCGARFSAILPAFAAVLLFGPAGRTQTSDAILLGSVAQAATGLPIAKALVVEKNIETNAESFRYTNEHGLYFFSALLPGTYSVRVYAVGFEPEEQGPLALNVSGRREVNFALRARPGAPAAGESAGGPPSPAGRSQVARALDYMYGADAEKPKAVPSQLTLPNTETVASSVSSVIDERRILELSPILELGGNDIYTLLLIQPGVTSDQSTARGLGSSVNGQRFTSSNFLLDGLDNNEPLATGPATRISSDAVKEFRVTTNNFSAEYGRASGFIAQAITRTGTNSLHGTAYEYFKHDALNANSFSNNWRGIPRPPFREDQYGGSLGGPLRRDRLFAFGNIEHLPLTTLGQSSSVFLPSPLLISLLPASNTARQLLEKFPPPQGEAIPGFPLAVRRQAATPFAERDMLALGRLDFRSAAGKHRLGARYGFSSGTVDDVVRSDYPGLSAPLDANAQSLAASYIREVAGGANELKFGFARSTVEVLRREPDVPTLISLDGISLPGSPATYDYSFHQRAFHLVDNLSLMRGRHSLTAGAEWRHMLHDSLLSPARDGIYLFGSIFDFLGGQPRYLLLSVNPQTGLPLSDRDYWRFYRQREMSGFLHDSIKLGRGFRVNLGVRYEYFGPPVPRNGTVDTNFVFGAGGNIGERIVNGRFDSGGLYRPDRNNFAPRVGFVLDLGGEGTTVVRGAYGVFFDRVFDSFWLDSRLNSTPVQLLANLPGLPPQFEYRFPAREGAKSIAVADIQKPSPVLVDPGLRTPYGQSWFLGLQRQVKPSLLLEVNHTGSVGRKLPTADTVNRLWSLPASATNSSGRFKPEQGDTSYRANQGHSDYLALQLSVNRHWSRGFQFQAAYTLARTRDVQSDPLLRSAYDSDQAGANFVNPSFFQVTSSFTRQFDPSSDYGLSDFNQRHNLVFSFVAEAPAMSGPRRILGRWQVSALAAFRSGFPFTVYTTQWSIQYFALNGGGLIFRNRASASGNPEQAFLPHRAPLIGGALLLDPSRFEVPADGQVGNVPRNAFNGPGFWNADFSVGRSFRVIPASERLRLQLRAEFFNAFNHVNLGNPDPFLESSSFGQALFGRRGFRSALPTVLPLNEQPRRIQLAVKLVF